MKKVHFIVGVYFLEPCEDTEERAPDKNGDHIKKQHFYCIIESTEKSNDTKGTLSLIGEKRAPFDLTNILIGEDKVAFDYQDNGSTKECVLHKRKNDMWYGKISGYNMVKCDITVHDLASTHLAHPSLPNELTGRGKPLHA